MGNQTSSCPAVVTIPGHVAAVAKANNEFAAKLYGQLEKSGTYYLDEPNVLKKYPLRNTFW